jgi:hypothetical protein
MGEIGLCDVVRGRACEDRDAGGSDRRAACGGVGRRFSATRGHQPVAGRWYDPEFLPDLRIRAQRLSLAGTETKRIDRTVQK